LPGGAGNPARSRLLSGLFLTTGESSHSGKFGCHSSTSSGSLADDGRVFAPGKRRLKAGYSQDWLPHDALQSSTFLIGFGFETSNPL